jgi:hypothetical protein
MIGDRAMHDREHEWARELLAEYLVGGLSGDERARLEAHSAACSTCGDDLEELRKHDLSVPEAQEPEPSPSGVRERLIRSRRVGTSRQPRSAVGQILLSGAALVLLGIVGFVISELDQTSEKLIAADRTVTAASTSVPSAASNPALELERPRDVFARKGIPQDDRVAPPTDEPAIFFPEAKESNHNESADNEDYQMKGDSANFLSYIKGEAGGFRGRQAGRNPGVYDTMGVGVGEGAGGRYGGRSGGPYGGRLALRESPAAKEALPDSSDRPEYFKPSTVFGSDRKRPSRETVASAPESRPAGAASGAKTPQEAAPEPSRKIIRSGEMEFEIDSFDSSVATLTKISIEEKGFVATVNSEKLQNGKVRGTVVVRVPPDRLDTLLLKLRALGDLKSQRIGSEDVTKHYTDLESRLRAARTMEERLLKIIKDGKGEIKDLLQAERELGEWRTKIETMVGEINYYNNLISLSTLALTLYEREIKAPFGLIETERIELGLEVEDVETSHREALAAIAEAKGRVTRSELKQLSVGQFNAIIQCEVPPERAGTLRDRLKQLGYLARLDINRSQETQGGSGRAQDAKVQQNDTQILISIYNLANVAPRETVHLSLACLDAEKSYRTILDRVEKAGGRILASRLLRPKGDQTTGSIQFHVKAVDAEAVLQDARATGEVLKLDVIEESDTANATRSKRGYNITIQALGMVQPRETTTVVLATRDVAPGYRALLEAARAADARILAAQLNENDRKNMTATLNLEVRREHEKEVADAMAKAGDVYTRNSTRAQDVDNVVDSKVLLQIRLFDAANIPARETVKLSVEVSDVEAATKGLESEFKGRIVDARHSREASGQRESTLSIDVPLQNVAVAVERIKGLGTVQEHVATKNAAVPDNSLAVARVEIRLSNEILVGRDSGPWANIRRGLAISAQAGSWSLMLIMIGLCFVLPLVLVIWGGLRLLRRFRPKAAAAAPAA